MCGFFYGWYLKCQSDTQTLAVIPAIHWKGRRRSCSIQVITESGTWGASFPAEAFRRERGALWIGKNRFGKEGVRLAVREPGLEITGKLRFGSLAALKYDIMGPFSLLPFLECRHQVWSMEHKVQGSVCVNGQEYRFRKAVGYWEGDRGRSFPSQYIWTQSMVPGGSLMLAVADVPVFGRHIRGIICVALLHGREYRLATYLGAKAVQIGKGLVRVVQGDMELEARILEWKAAPLKAPAKGDMARVIHENVSCRAFYRFRKRGQVLVSVETQGASFEYEYPY